MEINLPPEYNNYMNSQIAAGVFSNYAEIIEAGISSLMANQELVRLGQMLKMLGMKDKIASGFQ